MSETEDWKKHVADWRASGQSAEVYGRAHGLSRARIWQWSSSLRKLEREAGGVQPVRMVRVVQRRPEENSGWVTIEIGDARIVVRRGVDRETLGVVFETVDGRNRRIKGVAR